MFNKILLGKRLKYARKRHQLTLNDLAIISVFNNVNENISIINPSSLSQWENGSAVLRVDFIHRIADVYGISVDWLLGRTSNPYDSSVLAFLESQFIDEAEYIKADVEPGYIDKKGRNMHLTLPSFYINPVPRKKNYPDLGVRANILFIYNKVYKLALYSHLGSDKLSKGKFFESDEDKAHFYDTVWYDLSSNNDFLNLLNRRIKYPIYSLALE